MEWNLQSLFTYILNMSITGSYVILFVILTRQLLKKVPKIFSYSLWAVVLFRLVCPYSFSSTFSLLKSFAPASGKIEHIPLNMGMRGQPQVDVGIDGINDVINSSLPAATPFASVNPMQIILYVISIVWIIGMLSLVTYSIVSYIQLKKRVRTAMLIHDNIFESENIETPFVLGIIKPKIYLPIKLCETEKSYILKHEQTHIERFDNIVKPFAYLVLCVHWFNPLVWISFILMSCDMEMSCDEKVIKELGNEIKKEYSISLMSMSVSRRIICGSPLAFGESNAKKRIKNILNYRRPPFWILVVVAIVVFVFGIGLITNPINDKVESIAQSYLNHRTEYVGDASKVGAIINMLTLPENVSYDHFELQTNNKPYGVTIYLKTAIGMLDEAMVSDDMLYNKNSLMLFSLIGNTDEVIFNLSDGEKDNTIQYSRDWANNTINKDVWRLSESQSTYKQFLGMLDVRYSNPKDISSEPVKKALFSVEESLKVIMSSPLSSSNPDDYITAHSNEYENILKYGGIDALNYMLSQFQNGYVKNDLRGHIMMRLCKDLLGAKSNVTDASLLPLDWYTKLDIKEQTMLSDFSYEGNDFIQKLVYTTETEKNKSMKYDASFLIVAPHIHGSYEEGNKLKVFVTTYAATYKLFGKIVTESSGSIVPVAITYTKNTDGSYTLFKYEQSKDGSYWAPSIKEFCTMPVSGMEIKGLADKIIKHYSNYEDIIKLNTENLKKHLKSNGQTGISQKTNSGEIVPLT